MKRSTLVLAAAAFLLAGTAGAQVPRGFNPPSAETRNMASNNGTNAQLYGNAVNALQGKNFAVAEGLFQDFLRSNPTHPDANLMMGTTKMSLNKWDEAKKYLEIAVEKAPKNPDPKSRLGVTLIKLGDMDGAMKQRDELVKMDKACKGTCRNAQYIAADIAMIDGAMPPKQP